MEDQRSSTAFLYNTVVLILKPEIPEILNILIVPSRGQGPTAEQEHDRISPGGATLPARARAVTEAAPSSVMGLGFRGFGVDGIGFRV